MKHLVRDQAIVKTPCSTDTAAAPALTSTISDNCPSDLSFDDHGQAPLPMRVAFVVSTFGIGGAERCIARLANHLDRARYAPIIICLHSDNGASEWLHVDDVPVIELHKRPRNDLRAICRLATELKRHRVHLVHSHNWGTLIETTVARFFARTPIHVHAERGMRFSDSATTGLRTWLRYRAMRWALNRAQAVVAVADVVRERLFEKCGRLKSKVYVLANGVDVPSVSDVGSRTSMRSQLGIPADAVVIGSIGRLAPIKDFAVAVESIAGLRGRDYDVHLLLVGDGPDRSQLEARAKSLGCTAQVHLVGHQEDVGDWYRAMDIYLNVSQSEGMSQAILEAMSLGLPMVVTDVGANRSLAGGDQPCGLIVPSGNPAAVEAAVARLAENPPYRKQLSANAVKRYVSQYRVKDMVDRYDQLYMRLAEINIDQN